MINKYAYKELAWIDLESPTRDEVKKIMDEYGINPLVAQELLSPSIRPKIELHSHFIYFVLHIPALRHSHKLDSNQEIDFILGKNFIITTHYDSIDPIHKFSRIFEVNSILDRADLGQHAGFIFYYMLNRIYKELFNELEAIDDSLKRIEGDIFGGKEKEMVFELSNTARNMLDFKQSISHHKDILNGLHATVNDFFGGGFDAYIKLLQDEYEKIRSVMSSQNELLDELRSTNDSLLNAKQNETMKIFTVMAFSTLPISLVISIISIQAAWNPIFYLPYGHQVFWLLVSLVALSIISMILYFKYKKWL